MSKKHFIALADAIKNSRRTGEDYFSNAELQILADAFQGINPRFNRERWLGYIAGTNGKNGGSIK
jgi:hypothetical protein